jgi:HAD superfamily hydrolase (TIGR01509 family)
MSKVAWADELRAITFDFGNTLVAVDRAALHGVVETTARAVVVRLGSFDLGQFMAIWAEERERQFREEVPQFREVDLAERFVRVLARLRGMAPPSADGRWDQATAEQLSEPEEISWAVETYSRAFVQALPPAPAVGHLLERLARRHRLAILSNWPLAVTIDRYVEAAGWAPYLAAVVVSQRVGTIKPDPAIFAAAAEALGSPPPATILHVGDDWAADVVGAANAGWRTAYLDARPADSPLPSSLRDGSVVPDLELADLADLYLFLGLGDR